MLVRVLEPEVMDSETEARDYDSMDHAAVNDAFADDFAALWRPAGDAARCEVLDVGAGTALIPIEICRRVERAHVTAIDLSQAMLDIGEEHVARAGLGQRVALELVDAKALPYDDGRFDAVVSNSIVHHIPEPRGAIAEMARVLRDGGALLVRDLLRPADEPTLDALVQRYAGDCTPRQRSLFEASLWASLTVDEVRAFVAELGFDPAGVTQSSDRHWTWTVAPSN